VKVACDALDCDLEANGMTVWIEVDEETLVAQHLREGDIVASVKNGRQLMNLEPVT
jgi:hypothetical protein